MEAEVVVLLPPLRARITLLRAADVLPDELAGLAVMGGAAADARRRAMTVRYTKDAMQNTKMMGKMVPRIVPRLLFESPLSSSKPDTEPEGEDGEDVGMRVLEGTSAAGKVLFWLHARFTSSWWPQFSTPIPLCLHSDEYDPDVAERAEVGQSTLSSQILVLEDAVAVTG